MRHRNERNLSRLPNFCQLPNPLQSSESRSLICDRAQLSPPRARYAVSSALRTSPALADALIMVLYLGKNGVVDVGIISLVNQRASSSWLKLTKLRFGIEVKFGQKNCFLRILDPFHPWQITSNLDLIFLQL